MATPPPLLLSVVACEADHFMNTNSCRRMRRKLLTRSLPLVGWEIWKHMNPNVFLMVQSLVWRLLLFKQWLMKEHFGAWLEPQSSKSCLLADGTYALKKVLIQNEQHLQQVRQEIRVSSQFIHPNLLPLLENAIIAVKGVQDGSQNHEAYLLFPVHLDGTLQDINKNMLEKKEYFPTISILQIFRQLCAGLMHMHSFDPPYSHNGVKPDNVLITQRKDHPHLAILMDFESARPARIAIRSQADAMQLQEWASEHCSAHYRAPELWECPSHADIDERTDIWSLGCCLYAMMYGKSPFDYELDEASGESLQSVTKSAQFKWPTEAGPSYPDSLRQFVTWMLQPHPAVRPHIDDIIIHVDKLIAKYSI